MAETDSYNEQQRESSSLTARHSRLSIEAGDSAAPVLDDDDNDGHGDDNVVTAAAPLDQRILEIVHRNRTIRPGLLAAELGLSVEDASAELCGLLAAVGGGPDGATFRFEAIQPKEDGSTTSGIKPVTMVFTFPPDFEKRARRQRRREDLGEAAYRMLRLAVKVLKIVTAFGLILSLLILSVAALMALVAAMVALSRGDSQGGGHRHARGALLRQMRLIFYSVRQMLWCYALFGPTGDNTEDSEGQTTTRSVSPRGGIRLVADSCRLLRESGKHLLLDEGQSTATAAAPAVSWLGRSRRTRIKQQQQFVGK